MLGAGPSEVTLDDHLLLMIDGSDVQSVLEVLPETMTGLYLRVQTNLSSCSIDGRPDAPVATWN